jgi:excisionase family DNA binding protein
MGRSPSTIRGWLVDGSLRGYKLNRRDWRVPKSALRDYLDKQMQAGATVNPAPDEEVDIGAWRKLRGLPPARRRRFVTASKEGTSL